MTIIVYAFTMTQHHSIGGAKVNTIDQLNQKVKSLIKKGAQVLSIRVYQDTPSKLSDETEE